MQNEENKISAKITNRLPTRFYTEGPGLDAVGNLYFTTITGGKIMKLTPEEELEEWASCGYPNGQRILPNGDHLVCDCKRSEVIRFSAEGKQIKVEAGGSIEELPVNLPNDLAVDGENGFYFTDSTRHNGKVFYVSFDGTKNVVAHSLDYPNGIVLTPDKKALLVAESHKNRIISIPLQEAGVTRRRIEVFVNLPQNPKPLDLNNLVATGNLPDGLALDADGNLWIAHYGMQALQVVSPSGELITSIDTGIPATSNLCFSLDYKKVFVTGGKNEPGPGLIHTLTIE